MTHQEHIRRIHRLVATYPAFSWGSDTRRLPVQPVVFKWMDSEPGESAQYRAGEGDVDTQAESEQSR